MKRQPSRAPSPTPTAFSGISNYRTDSYRPIRDKNVPAVPQIDYRLVSKTHFDELSRYLAAYLAKAPPNSRATARQKLTRLTIQQFHELSTDVYDELVRRKDTEDEIPFLPLRSDFHPKRNQARQKLATLPASRFEDLSSDVYFELSRRYPEFKEDPSGNASNYDDYPVSDFPSTSPPRAPPIGRTSGRTSADRPVDSGYGGSVSSRRPSEDRRRPSEVDIIPPGRRSEDSYRRNDDIYGGRTSEDNYAPSIAPSSTSRRKPSQDTTRERDYGRRPSGAVSTSGNSDTTVNPNQSTTATSGMIIPNKSTIEEEYIKVPYGRERESGTIIDEREQSGDASRLTDGEPDSASDYPMSPQSPPAGLSGLSARLKGVNDDEEDDDERDPSGIGGRSGDDYYDKYGRSSVNSDRSAGNLGSRLTGRASVSEDHDKMRREYEYKIATMQTQISMLQRDLGDADEKERKSKEGEARVKQMEEELASLRRRTEEQSSTMRALQKELDELRETRQRESERAARRAEEDEDEVRILRDRCERLEEERENFQGETDMEIVDQLRSDMEGLLTELGDLSRRNDELMTAKDSDLVVIRELDQQLKDYKRKYEQAKTELRNVKATSQLFVQAPKFDRAEDQLPVSSDGGVADIHVTAFLSAVDALLTAGRSNAPTRVLTPMKSVVNAVTAIVDDVRAFERRPQRERSDVDSEALRSLRERAEATLSNLVAASKTHATSSGMSPVSLLDAATSHVSAAITEIGRTVCIRKATKAEQDHFSQTPYASTTATNGFSPSLRSVDETRSSHLRKGSSSSVSSRGRFSEISSTSPPNRTAESRRRPPSENSSSEKTNSPPPIFDQPANSGGVLSDDSTQADGSEDAWTELKPYLEAQTESIVYAIQSVLSGVRSPTPSPTLNENLTQIITIVSSIVAVCNDNLPPASSRQGNDILRELSDHANKLSEVQAMPEVTKESRQIMAKSSFAIANAMKALTRL
ncbi:hypothetical protein D9615_002290 [Tricholomella constricta]|uniref:GIT Spa2 homology (SHD) domain-containing protein n=1 Tax=Tricholomella constricta TaxID=117010 RepID=A0A8H5HMW1_9AGAR|nr:hypothetical protein D9615_002290 [Tricholomella constricta]